MLVSHLATTVDSFSQLVTRPPMKNERGARSYYCCYCTKTNMAQRREQGPIAKEGGDSDWLVISLITSLCHKLSLNYLPSSNWWTLLVCAESSQWTQYVRVAPPATPAPPFDNCTNYVRIRRTKFGERRDSFLRQLFSPAPIDECSCSSVLQGPASALASEDSLRWCYSYMNATVLWKSYKKVFNSST